MLIYCGESMALHSLRIAHILPSIEPMPHFEIRVTSVLLRRDSGKLIMIVAVEVGGRATHPDRAEPRGPMHGGMHACTAGVRTHITDALARHSARLHRWRETGGVTRGEARPRPQVAAALPPAAPDGKRDFRE